MYIKMYIKINLNVFVLILIELCTLDGHQWDMLISDEVCRGLRLGIWVSAKSLIGLQ